MSTKRKVPVLSVGLFLLIGLSLLGWMIVVYGGGDDVQKGYTVTVEFEDASGIINGGLVRIAGAHIGQVTAEPVLNENNRVDVEVTIKESAKLPVDTEFEIVALSLLGDKAIYLKVPEDQKPPYLKDGDRIMGVSPKGLDAVQNKVEALTDQINIIVGKTDSTFDNLNSTLLEYREVAQTLNTTLKKIEGDLLTDQTIEDLKISLSNIRNTSSSLEEFSHELKPIATETKIALQDFRKVTTNSNEAITKINERIDLIDPVLEALPQTIQTYDKVGVALEKSLSNEGGLLHTITDDKELDKDAKTFVKNLRVNGILGYKDNSNPEADDPRDRYRGVRR